jgi:putative Mg2+ transporter-C (MgtC) family protein
MMWLYLNDFIKIIISCLLGGLIGQQRQRKGMSIGIRTHIIVCVSATLVQIISIDYNIFNNANTDVMRLGAQVISGIGFLGMASIIKEGRTIVGLTTAASIWFIACVGLAVGSGIYFPAVIATLVIYFILKDVFSLDKLINSKRDPRNIYSVELVMSSTSNSQLEEVFNFITEKGAEICDISINGEEKNNVIISIMVSLPSKKLYTEIISNLIKCDFVKKVNVI